MNYPRWFCYVRLERDDPRYSVILDGDEMLVAVVQSLEAAEAVARLFSPQALMVLRALPSQRFIL